MSKGDPVKADENYLRESVLNPKAKVVAGFQPVMPSYKGQLSDDDIYCIIEWMKTMSKSDASEQPAANAEAAPK